MMSDPSRSASDSAEREFLRKYEPTPKEIPICAICDKAPLPMIPPNIASGSCAAICLLAARVPWRWTT